MSGESNGRSTSTYLAETLGLSMFLKAECGEMDARSEDFGFCEDTNTTDTVNLHLHIWVTVRVAEVGQMRAPGGVLRITFDNDCILIKSVCERERGFRLLPGVQIVGLFSSKPVGQWSPDV
tara:strand:- start:11767 stop:12129 length:363 start_codon:yes stop_codon:yes gene_type:complete